MDKLSFEKAKNYRASGFICRVCTWKILKVSFRIQTNDGRPVVNILQTDAHNQVRYAHKGKGKKLPMKEGCIKLPSNPRCKPKWFPDKKPVKKVLKKPLPECPLKEECDKFRRLRPEFYYKPQISVQQIMEKGDRTLDRRVDGKMEQTLKTLEQQPPMRLKFPFWHKKAKTVTLNDKQRAIKNKEVILKAQQPIKITNSNKPYIKYQPERPSDRRPPMLLKSDFWCKQSKTVFLSEKNVKLSKKRSPVKISKDLCTKPRIVEKQAYEPMKLRLEFRTKNARSVSVGK